MKTLNVSYLTVASDSGSSNAEGGKRKTRSNSIQAAPLSLLPSHVPYWMLQSLSF
jgi:hypothetical protein